MSSETVGPSILYNSLSLSARVQRIGLFSQTNPEPALGNRPLKRAQSIDSFKHKLKII